MNYTMMPVFTLKNICDIFNLQSEEEDPYLDNIDLCELFWSGSVCNDSYKRLSLKEDKFACNKNDILRNKIRAAVKSLYPNFDLMLVDVSW